jgi:ribosome-associated protein
MSEPTVIRLKDEAIRLGQFLKLADLVDTGADAKGLLARGLVRVNGDVETRRGRQLADGDVVELAGRRVVVSTGHATG